MNENSIMDLDTIDSHDNASIVKSLYRTVSTSELHMKPAKNRKEKIFVADGKRISNLRYGELPSSEIITTITNFDDVIAVQGIFKAKSNPQDPTSADILCTFDPESTTSKEKFVSVIIKEISENVNEAEIPLITLIRELPKEEFFNYLKDKLNEKNSW